MAQTTLPADLIARFKHRLGDRFVLYEPSELAVYDCDGCVLIKTEPDLVVIPGTTQEVAEVVKLCLEANVPYVARGSGTGLSGGALTVAGGVLISLARMNRIEEIDIPNLSATVEVGVINGWLNRDLLPHGLFFAPDPSSQSACTIGGNIAENSGGIHCVKYGVTVDHILALEVVLPDGEIAWLGSQSRNQHGYNLTGLITGSEGTLGIITRAIVRLMPKPENVRVYLAAFESTAQATDAVTAIMNVMQPAALEFMDAFTVKAVNEAFAVGFPENCEAVLLIELDGPAPAIAAQEKDLLAILQTHNVEQTRTGTTEQERTVLWAARKGAVAAYGRYYPAFYLHDCVIPRSQLTEIIRKINEIGEKHQICIGNVFHAGDGNLHPNILFDPDDKEQLEAVLAGGEEILEACLAVGGVLSGEHGIGIEKSAYMTRQFTEDDLNRMIAIKQTLDPTGLANPAKIFPVRKGCGETRMTLTHKMLATGQLWI